MKIRGILPLFCFVFLTLLSGARAQVTTPPEQASSPDSNPDLKMMPVYIRIANLVPIKQPKMSIMRGGDVYLSGINSGYVQGYTALEKKGGLSFSVVRDDNKQSVGTFDLKMPVKKGAVETPNFYTLVITGEKGAFKAQMFEDNQEAGVDGAPLPPRLRVFIGGADFPMTVNAGKWGSWKSDGNSVFEIVENPAPPPGMVSVSFTSKYDEPVDIFFPTDFGAHSSNSIFVSQRGDKRARLIVLPDSSPPMGEDGKPQALQ